MAYSIKQKGRATYVSTQYAVRTDSTVIGSVNKADACSILRPINNSANFN